MSAHFEILICDFLYWLPTESLPSNNSLLKKVHDSIDIQQRNASGVLTQHSTFCYFTVCRRDLCVIRQTIDSTVMTSTTYDSSILLSCICHCSSRGAQMQTKKKSSRLSSIEQTEISFIVLIEFLLFPQLTDLSLLHSQRLSRHSIHTLIIRNNILHSVCGITTASQVACLQVQGQQTDILSIFLQQIKISSIPE